jgi:hypothetical protein
LTLKSHSAKRDRRFVIVMFGSFALGLGVGLAVYFLWISRAANISAAVLVVCPPFILSYAISAAPNSAFAAVLGVGTIVLANGFLYAGAAAGMYAVVTLLAGSGKND